MDLIIQMRKCNCDSLNIPTKLPKIYIVELEISANTSLASMFQHSFFSFSTLACYDSASSPSDLGASDLYFLTSPFNCDLDTATWFVINLLVNWSSALSRAIESIPGLDLIKSMGYTVGFVWKHSALWWSSQSILERHIFCWGNKSPTHMTFLLNQHNQTI